MKTSGVKKKERKAMKPRADGGEESDDVYIVDNEEDERTGSLHPNNQTALIEAMFGRDTTLHQNHPNLIGETSPASYSNTDTVIDLTEAVDDTADVVIVDEVAAPTVASGYNRASAFQMQQSLQTEFIETYMGQDNYHRRRKNKRNRRSRSGSRHQGSLDEVDDDVDKQTNRQSKSDKSLNKKKRSDTGNIDNYLIYDMESNSNSSPSFVDHTGDKADECLPRKNRTGKGNRHRKHKHDKGEMMTICNSEMVDLSRSPANQDDECLYPVHGQKPGGREVADKAKEKVGMHAFMSTLAGYSSVQRNDGGSIGHGLRDVSNAAADAQSLPACIEETDSEEKQHSSSADEIIVVQNKMPKGVKTSTGVVVLIQHPAEFIVKGRLTLQTLVGSVTVMGYNVESSGTKHDIFSPNSNSQLAIKTKHGENNVDTAWKTVLDHDSTVENDEDFIKDTLQDLKDFVILKFEKLNSVMCDFVTHYSPYQHLFDTTLGSDINVLTSKIGVSLHGDCNSPCIKIPSELRRIMEAWTSYLTNDDNTGAPAMMVCGGKDSGKSTTNRLLMNSSLNRVEEVYFLECDVGQTEFTPAGCVSLHRISQPIFGPPFCHQLKPVIAYHFGGLSPQDDPDAYLDCVRRCYRHYQQTAPRRPLIVNTMGWLRGLGLQLLIDTIRLVSPTHLVQLMCRSAHNNVAPISEEFLQQTSWSDLTATRGRGACPGERRTLQRQHQLFIVDTPLAGQQGFASRLKAVDHRNLSLLSHLSSDLEPGLTLTSMVPYTVPFHCVAIHVAHSCVPQSQALYSINASVVALCKADLSQTVKMSDDWPMFFNKDPVCQWLGYGVVRGIDKVKKLLYIVTPLPSKILQQVNTLVKGTISLPEQILMTQTSDEPVPYVDDTVKSLGAGALRQRRHMPRRGLH